MIENKTRQPGPVRAVASVFGRTSVVGAGLGLMIVGVGMGVTMVMLPVGILVGFAGVALVAAALAAAPRPQ